MDNSNHINELLAYLSFYLHSSNVENIKRISLIFYDQDEIINSKKILWTLCSNHLDNFIDRKNTDKRSSAEANIQDIMDGLLKLDAINKLPNFVAKQLNKIPDRQPEELNIFAMINRVAKLEKKMCEYEEIVNSHECRITSMESIDIKNTFEEIKENVNQLNEGNILKINESVIKAKEENENLNTLSTSGNEEIVDSSRVENDDLLEWETISETSNSKEYPQKDTYKNILLKVKKEYNKSSYCKKKGKKIKAKVNENRRLNKDNNDIRRKHQSNDKIKTRNLNEILNATITTPSTLPSLPSILDNEGFCLVQSRADKKRRYKNERSENVRNFKGAEPRIKHVFISNVISGDVYDIKEYFNFKNVNICNIERVSHDNAKLKSFKIAISEEKLDLLLNNNFWPKGVQCRLWRDKRSIFTNKNQFDYNHKAYRYNNIANWVDLE